MTHPEGLDSRGRLQIPTLAYMLKMDISDKAVGKEGGRNFSVVQNERLYTFDLAPLPALIFREFFFGTRFPTIEEMKEKLPWMERKNLDRYLQELNAVIAGHLRTTLEPTIKLINGNAVSFLALKKAP